MISITLLWRIAHSSLRPFTVVSSSGFNKKQICMGIKNYFKFAWVIKKSQRMLGSLGVWNGKSHTILSPELTVLTPKQWSRVQWQHSNHLNRGQTKFPTRVKFFSFFFFLFFSFWLLQWLIVIRQESCSSCPCWYLSLPDGKGWKRVRMLHGLYQAYIGKPQLQ